MKQVKRALLGAASVALASTVVTFAPETSWAQKFNYGGYFRAGVGTNNKGGDQVCFNNPGDWQTDLPKDVGRLGNECDTYLEWTFSVDHVKPKKAGDPFFKSYITLAGPLGGSNVGWEPFTPAGQEAYVEAGNVLGNGVTYWAGKRFYREDDMHILDWRPFASMSGDGAGAQIGLPSNMRLDVATMRYVDGGNKDSDIGKHGITLYDLRLKNIAVGDAVRLMLWAAFGSAPSGETKDDKGKVTKYESQGGNIIGLKASLSIKGGANHFTISRANGLLWNHSTWENPAKTKTEVDMQDDKNATRITNDLQMQISNQFAFWLDAYINTVDTGEKKDSMHQRWGIVTRPMLFITDNFRLVAELGHSNVTVEGAKDSKGNDVDSYQLTKFTIAPELGTGRGMWDRPVIRAYYTTFSWDDDNKGKIGGAAYADDTSASSYGFQSEVWW